MKRYFLLCLALACCSWLGAQTEFTGRIEYTLTYTDAGIYEAFLPTGTIMYYGGKYSKKVGQGPMSDMTGDVLSDHKKKMTYFIMHSENTVYKIKNKDFPALEEADGTEDVSKTLETDTILGYPVRKYEVTRTIAGIETKYTIWATDSLTLPSAAADTDKAGGSIPGLALKTITTVFVMGTTITTTETVTNIIPGDFSSEFVLPKEYTVKKGLPPMLETLNE